MKTLVTLGSLFLSVCIISSCSQETYHLDAGYTLKQYKIVFDSSLESYHIYDRDLNGIVVAERDSFTNTVLKMNLAYGGNGRVTQAAFSQDGGPVTYTYDFEYNSLGKIGKRQRRSGSLTVSEDYNVYTYDVAGNLLTDSQFSKTNGTSYQLAWVSKFTYDGSNVTVGESYQVVNGSPQLYARVKNEYDIKINPLKFLPNEYYYNEAGNAIYAIVVTSYNNVVRQYVATGNGNYQPLQTYNYDYNANSYAWKARSVNATQASKNSATEYFYE